MADALENSTLRGCEKLRRNEVSLGSRGSKRKPERDQRESRRRLEGGWREARGKLDGYGPDTKRMLGGREDFLDERSVLKRKSVQDAKKKKTVRTEEAKKKYKHPYIQKSTVTCKLHTIERPTL